MPAETYTGAAAARFHRALLDGLDPAVAAQVVAVSSDVAMVIDRDGVICDLALNSSDLRLDGFENWLDKRWMDTVTVESRIKVDELLRDAADHAKTRWREINHPTVRGGSVALKYVAVDAGLEGRILALGRDHRETAAMQQRLLHAQQSMERDYARLRDAESRYRLLFQMASEAVLIVDTGTRRVIEANPAAERLVGADGSLVGRPFVKLFSAHSQDAAVSLLSVAQSAARPTGAQGKLTIAGRDFSAAASIFRQDRSAHYLVRLSPADREAPANDAGTRLLEVLERLPDGFVVTDESLHILTENTAFLDLVRLPTKEQARGQPLDRFLGRPGIDRGILLTTLREHGVVRNFPTVLRSQFLDQEDVEVSAVAATDGAQPCFGFSIRSVSRREERAAPRDLPQTAKDMSDLVGRVSMKEIVRETTDLVERLCIEAALELTHNNRASAAEVLGLSRQSLYSKLHRFGMASGGD